ncbi:hypothetical protein ACO2RV_19090 [Ancylobacter sp. VNQ12]|uniref:hypothetical protein n=1 Tax=Ancylobacter sp. VNQ12 TaxID=3400920 RepID=UPI003C0E47BD
MQFYALASTNVERESLMPSKKEPRRPLEYAVAHYLFLLSKDVPDDESGLYRATALALIGEPVSPDFLALAAKHKSNDDPLYDRSDIRLGPDLEEVWGLEEINP